MQLEELKTTFGTKVIYLRPNRQYILFGVHCNPLACDTESKGSDIIDAPLGLVFLAGESLFPMRLVFF